MYFANDLNQFVLPEDVELCVRWLFPTIYVSLLIRPFALETGTPSISVDQFLTCILATTPINVRGNEALVLLVLRPSSRRIFWAKRNCQYVVLLVLRPSSEAV